MHSLLKGLLVVFGLTLASCSPVPTVCPTLSPFYRDQDLDLAYADFAIGLFRNCTSHDDDKNQIMSPISIALALSLLESGADGKTQQDLQHALLENKAAQEKVLAVYRQLQKRVSVDKDNAKLTIANALFQDKTLKINVDYATAITQCLDSQVQQVDFQNQLEQTRQQVNQFISQKTNQKIPELFKPGVLRQQDRFILANAIYFKASWRKAFVKSQTKKDTFYRNGRDTDKQQVDFMQTTQSLYHSSFNDYNVDVLEMPYGDADLPHDLSMYIILPKTRDGVRDLEKGLTGPKLHYIINTSQQKYVNVQLPKFNVRSSIDLKPILMKMGLDSLFSNEANFDRLSDTPIQIDSSIHEAYLNLDENGTEGAAATGFAGVPMSVVDHEVAIPFKADHPFLYTIVHKQTGTIVFLGKVNSVEQQP
jgi:serpin B